MASRLEEKYTKVVAPALMEKFEYKNVMEIPKLVKIVINMGCGDARENPKGLEKAVEELEMIAGQKPVVTRARKSVAKYLSHRKEFYGYEFYVDENVLIPQPDTEILVETAIEVLGKMKNPRVIDLCTGSGCIGTSIRMNVRDAKVSLSDISPEALEIARRNYRNITGETADARLGDLFEPWKGERFDFIATNPPYVTTEWYKDVSEEVKNEPTLALLDYAEDGLDIIRRIINDSKAMLNEGGALIIESDYRQCIRIREAMRNSGYSDIRTMKDLSGRERCTIGFLFS